MIKGLWSNKSSSAITGANIEKQASKWLKQKGLSLVTSNYRCKQGEIDLIMRENNKLVFIEVRFRSRNSFGDGLESVNWQKQQKLLKAANHFLMVHSHYANEECRFDVLGVNPSSSSTNKLQWTWIKNAFSS
jgi:putative endonuclease